MQPPPHGCVLKPLGSPRLGTWREAAASARLCVETSFWIAVPVVAAAAAFGRLCVETNAEDLVATPKAAAAFARLCVET